MSEQPTDQQIADSLLHALEHLFGERGIWKDKLTWKYQREAVQEVQRLLAIGLMQDRELPELAQIVPLPHDGPDQGT